MGNYVENKYFLVLKGEDKGEGESVIKGLTLITFASLSAGSNLLPRGRRD